MIGESEELLKVVKFNVQSKTGIKQENLTYPKLIPFSFSNSRHGEQHHFLLATVLLLLGIVVHDASTATLNNGLDIATSQRAPNPSKLENSVIYTSNSVGDDPGPEPEPEPEPSSTTTTPTTTVTTTTISPTTTTTTAPPTTTTAVSPPTTITAAPPTTTTAASPPTSTAAPPSTTTAASPPTTTSPAVTTPASSSSGTTQKPTAVTTPQTPTTTEQVLPDDEIWEQIQKELKAMNTTLTKLQKFVNDVEPPTSTPGTVSTEVPTASTSTSEVTTTTTATLEKTLNAEQRILPLYFLRKVMLGKFMAKEDPEICTPDTDTLCKRLKKVLENIKDISAKILVMEEVSMNDLTSVRENSTELTDVSTKIEEDTSFVINHMDVAAFNKDVNEVVKGLGEAVTAIDDKLATDNTLAIVLGTLGGILGVALIIGGIMMYRKKKNKRKGKNLDMNMEQRVNPSSTKSSTSSSSSEDS
ncbi:uncharacterized protein [Palaemon carinicauda]|uniref:uncharacterized protein n=1 Tax=Palaemon carinicauda TaxID=392227 RepID=UPI0035B60B6C